MPDQDDSVSRILKTAEADPGAAAELERFRRNITVMFTDIKGSTAYFERFGDSAGTLMLDECNGMVASITEKHGGHVVKTIGDSVMAYFEANAEAVMAAIEMQKAIVSEEALKPPDQRIAIRIGLNHGPGIVKKNDVFGDVVNTASRVEANAAPEQIVVSDTVHHDLAHDARFQFRYLGRFELKGKAETRDLFEAVWNQDLQSAPTATHSRISPDPKIALSLKYCLQQVRSDGTHGPLHLLDSKETVIGRESGKITFPRDTKLHPRHARFTVEAGQLFVEAFPGAEVHFSLVAPYRLEDGDIIRMGKQVFRFQANRSVVEAAANSGVRIRDLIRLVNRPPAEFTTLGPEPGSYVIREEEVTWGRSNGTYVFPNDLSMSRVHAKVVHRGEDFYLEDAGSRNGTFVKVRQRTQIPIGVVLLMGGQLLRVQQTT